MSTDTPSTRRLADDLVALSGQLIRLVGAGAETSVSSTQARVLARLRDGGSLRITELARFESCTQPSMTSVVDRLERGRLVTRRSDDADGRAVLVTITEEGRRQLAAARASMAGVLTGRLAALSESDRARLNDYTQIMRRLIGVNDN